ncbi:helix-turn-helix domain-containing protein [Nonomuraea sp. 3N208]|uniref:helix-turn-helix domain-containing protein n=1 Tax=Nonomuraea sp. 3N208 TaxID=3457421 RepID=UPI003FCE84BB
MVRVRGHWRRTRSGMTWVRAHTRGRPVTAGVGFGLGIAALIAGGVLLWPKTSGQVEVATQSQATATRAPLTASHAQLVQMLRTARQRMGLTVEQAAGRAGMTPAEIIDIESGLTVPTGQDISVLAQVYTLSPDEWTTAVILQSSIT